MPTAEYVLKSLVGVEHHVKLLSAANGAGEIVDAVSRYLESWPVDRIESLQKIDGGWGTFDNSQRPESINTLEDIARISGTLSGHCRALKEARLEPTPELLELDLYFALAKQAGEKFIPGRSQSYAAPRAARADTRWAAYSRVG